MSFDPYRLLRPALFRSDPETAHDLAIHALKLGVHPRDTAGDRDFLRQSLVGLDFPNPLGMAAGFDKNAEAPDALLAMGFGFVEVGTVTPLAQDGNPRPRMFRLVEERAVINRLGFNGEGHAAAAGRLKARERTGIVGVNIGANKDSADRMADYAKGAATFAPLADYLTVNVSSPNTPGLRDLQGEGALDELLNGVIAAMPPGARVPLFVKIAPDLDEIALQSIVTTALSKGVDGLIVSNTTVGREGVANAKLAAEAGGLSGRPLFQLSTRVLARARVIAGDRLVLIGVGGVSSGGDVLTKIRAGASLVQLYTAMVYQGPGIAMAIKCELCDLMVRDAITSLSEISGSEAERLQGLGL